MKTKKPNLLYERIINSRGANIYDTDESDVFKIDPKSAIYKSNNGRVKTDTAGSKPKTARVDKRKRFR